MQSQGHFQIMFSWQHCPLFQRKLSWIMRILYSSGVWSYIVGAISTPTFIVIPCVTIWFGVFPIVVSQWAALGVTVYYLATNMVSQASLTGVCNMRSSLDLLFWLLLPSGDCGDATGACT